MFLVVAETTLASFQTYTGLNQTHDDNGVSWYYNGFSAGFTLLGNSIRQEKADVNLEDYSTGRHKGLSWYTNFNGEFEHSQSHDTFHPGWGANNGIFVPTDSDQYSRVILDGGINGAQGLNAVPEPTSIALLGMGLLGFVASRRKKNQA